MWRSQAIEVTQPVNRSKSSLHTAFFKTINQQKPEFSYQKGSYGAESTIKTKKKK